MLEDTKKEIKDLNKMEKIGFGRKEAIALMENIAKEMK